MAIDHGSYMWESTYTDKNKTWSQKCSPGRYYINKTDCELFC